MRERVRACMAVSCAAGTWRAEGKRQRVAGSTSRCAAGSAAAQRAVDAGEGGWEGLASDAVDEMVDEAGRRVADEVRRRQDDEVDLNV